MKNASRNGRTSTRKDIEKMDDKKALKIIGEMVAEMRTRLNSIPPKAREKSYLNDRIEALKTAENAMIERS